MRALRALNISEERKLAGTVAGFLYLTGAVTVSLMLLMPSVETRHWVPVLVLAGVGLAWGVACLTVVPWERVHPLVSHLSSLFGFPLTAIAMALTGGADSPARFLILFVVFYCSYFYPRREAIPYLGLTVAVLALPALYQPNALEDGLAAELLVMGPTAFVIGRLIIDGKDVMLGLSQQDPLTGLLNRRALTAHLREHIGGRRLAEPLGLMLVDLDDFKAANTRFGHPTGDNVLCQAALAFRTAVRQRDAVARLGGDEFAIVVPGADTETMETLTGRVLAELGRADERVQLPDWRLSASVGWAMSPADGDDPEALVQVADERLRGAKAESKHGPLATPHWAPELAG